MHTIQRKQCETVTKLTQIIYTYRRWN